MFAKVGSPPNPLVKRLSSGENYTLKDLIEIGKLWNGATTEEKKKIIINTHNGFTDGHYPNLGKRWQSLDHQTQSIIGRNWHVAHKPFDKNRAGFFEVSP